ncbi:glycyl radical enzyme domain-containing protein, partial [Vibrio diabolicus]
VRMNLKEVAERASDCNDFLNSILPLYHQLMVELMDARSTHLHEKSNFFQGFLTQEGLIEESRFAPMYGIYGMAEAVNLLFEKEGQSGQYGKDERAN